MLRETASLNWTRALSPPVGTEAPPTPPGVALQLAAEFQMALPAIQYRSAAPTSNPPGRPTTAAPAAARSARRSRFRLELRFTRLDGPRIARAARAGEMDSNAMLLPCPSVVRNEAQRRLNPASQTLGRRTGTLPVRGRAEYTRP